MTDSKRMWRMCLHMCCYYSGMLLDWGLVGIKTRQLHDSLYNTHMRAPTHKHTLTPILKIHTHMHTHTQRERQTAFSNQVSILNCPVTRKPGLWPALPSLSLWAYVSVAQAPRLVRSQLASTLITVSEPETCLFLNPTLSYHSVSLFFIIFSFHSNSFLHLEPPLSSIFFISLLF